MKIQTRISVFILIWIAPSLYAQNPDAAALVSQITTNFINQHTQIPPSPQASDFGRFGNIPVNHFTGTANISVPIHSVEAGGLTTSLTLNYETSGLLVATRPSWTGMGWNLNTGAGAISVTINGFPDQLDNYFGENTNPVVGVSQNTPTYQDWIIDCIKGKLETQPDIYSVNFMGYSGKFYITNEGEVVFFEYTDLDIEVTIGGTPYNPCVGPFIVTTKDGIQGIFNVTEETTIALENNEESSQYFPFVNWRTYNSAWYPSLVKNLKGKGEAHYTYVDLPEEQMEEFSITGRAYTYHTYWNWAIGDSNCPDPPLVPTNATPSVNYGLTSFVTLKRKRLSELLVKNYDVNVQKMTFIATLPSVQDDGELEKIIINGSNSGGYLGGVLREYNFGYNLDSGRKSLSTVSTSSSEGDLEIPPFKFYYDGFYDLPSSTASESLDHWGLFNAHGTGVIPSVYGFYGEGADRNPNAASSAGLLTKIVYPTGGTTSFEYEPNTVWDPISQSNVVTKGVRVKGMDDIRYGTVLHKEFYYISEWGSVQSSGTDFNPVDNTNYYKTTSNFVNYPSYGTAPGNCLPGLDQFVTITGQAEFPNFWYRGPVVGYAKVFEVTEYGKTEMVFDVTPPPIYHTESFTMGDIKEKKVYDKFDNLVSEHSYTYNYDIDPGILDLVIGTPTSGNPINGKWGFYFRGSDDQDNYDCLCNQESNPGVYVWRVINPDGFDNSDCINEASMGVYNFYPIEHEIQYFFIPGTRRKYIHSEEVTEYFYDYVSLESGQPQGSLNTTIVTSYHPTWNIPVKETFYSDQEIIDEITLDYLSNYAVNSKRESLHSFEKDFWIDFNTALHSVYPTAFKSNESSGWVNQVELGDYNVYNKPQSIWKKGSSIIEILDYDKDLITKRHQTDWEWNYNYDYLSRQVSVITDMNGQTVNFSYDGLQRLSTQSSRNGNIASTMSYHYIESLLGKDGAYVLTDMEAADVNYNLDLEQHYDRLGYPTSSVKVDFNPNTSDFVDSKVYDNLGRVIAEGNTNDGVTQYTYEPNMRSNVIFTHPPGFKLPEVERISTVHGTDGENKVTTSTDENGNTTISVTDLLGRAKSKSQEGALTQFFTDDWGAVYRIIPPDCSVPECEFEFGYHEDNHSAITSKSIPGYGSISYNYTSNPFRLESINQPSGEIIYSYNTHDQVLNISGLNKTFTYYEDLNHLPSLGKIQTEVSQSLTGGFAVTKTYHYDLYGRLEHQGVLNHLGGDDAYSYEYDIMDNILSSTYNHSAFEDHTVLYTHTYDNGMRLQTIRGTLPHFGEEFIERNSYDRRARLNQLEQGVHGVNEKKPLQRIKYGYHDRGWIESVGNLDGVAKKIYPQQVDEEEEGDPDIYTFDWDLIIPLFHQWCRAQNVITLTQQVSVNQVIVGSVSQNKTVHVGNPATPDLNDFLSQPQNIWTSLTQSFLDFLDSQIIPYTLEDSCIVTAAIEGVNVIIDFCQNRIYLDVRCEGDRGGCPGLGSEEIERILIATFELIHQFLIAYYTDHPELLGVPCLKLYPSYIHQILDPVITEIDDFIGTHTTPYTVIPGSGLFAISLNYDIENTSLQGPEDMAGTARYNGDVAWMEWAAPIGGEMYYGLEYDELNRLKVSNFSTTGNFDPAANEYGENLSYADGRGNIASLFRRGLLPPGVGSEGPEVGAIDSLYFDYLPNNQIEFVEEFGPDDLSFRGALSSYGYANGNVTNDPSRGIGSIRYNILNLPDRVEFYDGSLIEIIYDGDGIIWRKTLTSTTDTLPNGLYQMVIDYIDGFEYHDGTFASYMHPQGRVAPGENGINCEYFIKDHLGSVRVVYADVDRDEVIDFDTVECELLEEHHYYPFGLEMEGMWSNFRTGQYVNRYTYNGKQAQTEMGWDWLNFGKRFYDPLVARFTGTDPIADQYSFVTPYNYAENSPITFIDLWGLQKFRWDGSNEIDKKGIIQDVTDEQAISSFEGAIVRVTFQLLDLIGVNKLDNAITDLVSGNGSTVDNVVNTFDAANSILTPGGLAKSKDPGLGNQFKDKTIGEVREAFGKQVESGKLVEKYSDPISGSTSYKNSKSGYSYNIDTGVSGKTGRKVEAPHIDVNYPNPKPLNKEKKKLPVKD